MNIKQLNQLLEQFLILNEMAIKDTPDLTNSLGSKSIPIIMDTLKNQKSGFVITGYPINIVKECEILPEKYTLCLNWGESNRRYKGQQLIGHGICHQLEGHSSDYELIKRNFEAAIYSKRAYFNSKRGTYDITYKNLRYGFSIFDETEKLVIFLNGFRIK